MTFPVEDFENIEFELIHDTRVPDKRLKRYRTEGSKEPYFMFALTTDLLDYASGMALGAELDAYQGELELFDLPNPILAIQSLSFAALAYDAKKGDKQITLATGSNNKENVAAAGDFLQISGSKKAYSIRRNGPQYDSDGSGNVVVTLTQGLIQDYSAGASIRYGEDVIFQVCLSNRDNTQVSGDRCRLIQHDVELIEQI